MKHVKFWASLVNCSDISSLQGFLISVVFMPINPTKKLFEVSIEIMKLSNLLSVEPSKGYLDRQVLRLNELKKNMQISRLWNFFLPGRLS